MERGRRGERAKGERQRKTIPSRPSDNANHFPLKLPFAPGQSSVSKAICPAERRATYIYLRGSNGPAKKGSGLVTFPERGKFRVRSVEGKQPEFSLALSLSFSAQPREKTAVFHQAFGCTGCNNFLSMRAVKIHLTAIRRSYELSVY